MNKVKSVVSLTAITAMTLPTAAVAGNYQCERAAVSAVFTSNGPPRGNWTFQNTANYKYVKASGNDVYQHKSLSLTVQTICLRNGPSGWNLGTRVNDHNGLEDACGTWSQAIPFASSPTNPCASGFNKSGDQGSCVKPATAATVTSNGTPRGNWTFQNTANYQYVPVPAAQGEDFYRNIGGGRNNVVSTLCQRKGVGGWDLGQRVNDFNGLEDACVTRTEATPAQTLAASCPAGFAMVYKP